ncbi:hypothetical protein [Natronorubrum sp. FCH18a]|uniref:hypothetical protein n=1 Tax=Natronorubrum sp. FCH18a TaxID=3447018 RepID=UPI003F50FD0F
MRRIYESRALRRDDEPFTPNETDSSERLQAVRSVNSTGLSRLLVPDRVGHRAISVAISSPRTEYPVGTMVPFRVTMKNTMPFPITISTNSPLLWSWSVDGVPEASHVPLRDPPDETGSLVFDRGERKQFTKRWHQHFRIADDEWEPAEDGTHTIGVELNVEDPAEKGLSDETTVRIVPDAEA